MELMKIYASGKIETVALTEQEEQVYNALEKWATRLNHWEYTMQIKRNHNKKLKTFSPNYFSLQLLENKRKMLNHEATPEETMSILNTVDGRTQTRLCMEAGF